MIDFAAEKAKRRSEWWDRTKRLYPDLVPKPPRNPVEDPGEVDPLLWEDSIYAIEKNIEETGRNLGLWQSRAQEVATGDDDEARWERELIFSCISRYKAEQAHWREYLAKHLRYLADNPGCELQPVRKRLDICPR